MLSLAIAMPLLSFAEASTPQGLLDVYLLALETEAGFVAERYAAEAIKQKASILQSGFFPTIQLSGDYAYGGIQEEYAERLR